MHKKVRIALISCISLLGIGILAFAYRGSIFSAYIGHSQAVRIDNDTANTVSVENCGLKNEGDATLPRGKVGTFYIFKDVDPSLQACQIFTSNSKYIGCLLTPASESNRTFYVSHVRVDIEPQGCGPEH